MAQVALRSLCLVIRYTYGPGASGSCRLLGGRASWQLRARCWRAHGLAAGGERAYPSPRTGRRPAPVRALCSRGGGHPAGAALLPYAERFASLGEEALEAAGRAEASPPLVLAVHSTFALRIVPLVLGALGATPRRVSIRDVHSDQVAALVLDGVADLGIALSGGTLKGLVRAPLPSDDVICVTGPNHRIVRLKRAKIADLRDCLIALNAWGDGASAFMSKLQSTGIDDWRIRLCADAGTALALARNHDHAALVTGSVVEPSEGIQIVPLVGLGGWTVRLDPSIAALIEINPSLPRFATPSAPCDQ